MPHHLRDDRVVGWGPTVRELDRLATRFESVRHVATLYPGPAPASAITYSAKNLELVPLKPTGGLTLKDKLGVAAEAPRYIRTILRELESADMVHVRAPANVALVAMVMLAMVRRPRPRWIKYAGNWRPSHFENPSYAFQRWWLTRGWHRGVVTVNGAWPDQPPWVRTFYNPSLDDDDIRRGMEAARRKRLTTPIRLLYVGRVETPKGAGRALEIVARLRDLGVAAELTLIGDGDERSAMERRATELSIADRVTFSGWQPPDAVHRAYEAAHVLLLPTSASEGWPKVLSEGMAYGVVPVAGAVSSIPQYIAELDCGVAIEPHDIDGFAAAIESYVTDPASWRRASERAVAGTRLFSFSHYLESVDELLSSLEVAS